MEGAHSSFGYGDTFNLVKKGFNLTKNLVKVPESVLKGTAAGLSGRAKISTSLVRVDAKKLSSIIPLPNRKLIKKDRKNLLYSLIANAISAILGTLILNLIFYFIK